MAPKNNNQEKGEKATNKIRQCGLYSPGPIYKLKTLVGHNDHCSSKLRNPAYTFGLKPPEREVNRSPGPIYDVKFPKHRGFTIGRAPREIKRFLTPGPYNVKEIKCAKQGFTIVPRTKSQKLFITPGCYFKEEKRNGPHYTIGRKPRAKSITTPGPYDVKYTQVETRYPKYSFGHLYKKKIFITPAPGYVVKSTTGPAFTFGMKYNQCVLPFITDCDAMC